MELVNWLRWQWRKWETWQKWWVLACFLMGASISAGAPFNLYFQLAGIAIFFFYALKWFIVESVMGSYRAYQKSKQDLLETIKTSHEK
jgi:hypothetical protein